MAKSKKSSKKFKLEEHLLLAPHIAKKFGFNKISEIKELAGAPEGFDSNGRSYIFHALLGRPGLQIPEDKLREYDDNIRGYVERISRSRDEQINLKYFQFLALLFTEYYLDELFSDPVVFMNDLTVAATTRMMDAVYSMNDIKKLAYWMATGSGKTIIMHINLWQMQKYNTGSNSIDFDNIILITSNESMSKQHLEELRKSGIQARIFQGYTGGYFSPDDREFVKVIDIYKLKLPEDKKGKGDTIDISRFGKNNLILVDEGHKGHKSEDKKWKRVREELAKNGFTFEYSATFGQAITSGPGKSGGAHEDFLEYIKTILFDYSYRYFHGDGYGKDFRILNLEKFDEKQSDIILLANAMSFYEQILVYSELGDEVKNYHIENPLWVFVGSRVNEDKSDVLKVVKFFSKLLENKGNWAEVRIRDILAGNSGLLTSDKKRDVFAKREPETVFPYLRGKNLTAEEVISGIYKEVFHLPTSAAGRKLHLADIKSGEGELGLRASGAREKDYFGLINIGNKGEFRKLVEDDPGDIVVEKDVMTEKPLFETIEEPESTINVLIGAKKFIEGWDCYRVSTMGLMNVGRGEGPQIIQLFGRGVRLRGKDKRLKRSNHLEPPHPVFIEVLETLGIFGIRATYMDSFRKVIEKEDVPTYGEIRLPVKVMDPFPEDLMIPRLKKGVDFLHDNLFNLDEFEKILAKMDILPKTTVVDSRREDSIVSTSAEEEPKTIKKEYLDLLQWKGIYLELLKYRAERGWQNVSFTEDSLKRVLCEGNYILKALNEKVVEPKERKFEWINSNLRDVVVRLLKIYLDKCYNTRRKSWEMDNMELVSLTKDDEVILDEYCIQVDESKETVIKEIEKLRDSEKLYTKECKKPIENVFFERHLFQPLLAMTEGEIIKTGSIGLNKGEKTFVEDLTKCLEEKHIKGLSDVFLLRNQARGKGIGFFETTTFYPDFILWIKAGMKQWVVFVDPKGLVFIGNLEDEKIKLHETLKNQLQPKLGTDNILLDSFIISDTSYENVQKRYPIYPNMNDYEEEKHILFQETKDKRPNPDYVKRLFSIAMNT